LGWLIDHNAFQNYDIVSNLADTLTVNEDSNEISKSSRKKARAEYDGMIANSAARLGRLDIQGCFFKLERLRLEQSENSSWENPRVPLDIKNDELGVVMRLCNFQEPADAKKVKIVKLKRLFGEESPWISAQYNRDDYADWAQVEAEKTKGILAVVNTLVKMQQGEMDGFQFAASLTRNKQLFDGVLALVSSEAEYLSTRSDLDKLKVARNNARANGSKETRTKVARIANAYSEQFLASVGVSFQKVKWDDGKMHSDLSKPIIPATWDLAAIASGLERRAALLKALPIEQKVPILDDEVSSGEKMMPRSICESCTFFYQNSCVQGKLVDWQGGEWEDRLAKSCDTYKLFRLKLAA
jgi:hypothetical protein